MNCIIGDLQSYDSKILNTHHTYLETKSIFEEKGMLDWFYNANKFTIIRNPFNRMISLYKYIQEQQNHYLHNKVINQTFTQFCYFVRNVGDEGIKSQFDHLKNEFEQIDDSMKIFKLEEIDNHLSELSNIIGKEVFEFPLINATKNTYYETTSESNWLITDVYKNDLERFYPRNVMKDLSILIPTLPARIESYSNLIKTLNKQITENNLIHRVQILSLCDTKEITVGEKRNILLKQSCGRYVCFIDDDDLISPNYISKIFNGIQSNADVITFCGEYKNNNLVTPFSISMVHRGNYNHPNIFYRLPNHLCPVKREIAIDSLFTDKNFGEDSDYSERINKCLKNEFHIQDKLYYYMYNENNSQTRPSNNLNAFS